MTAPADAGRIRLLYIVPPSRHFAGIERVVHEVATGLARGWPDSFDVAVASATDYAEPILADTAYRRYVLGVPRLRSLGAAVRRHLRAHPCDVLICPQVEASAIVWWAVRGRRSPLFVTHLHGNPLVEERDGVLSTRLAFTVFRHVIARRLAAILTVSPSLARATSADLGARTPVHYVPNPVRTLPPPDRPPLGPSPDRGVRFVSVARLSHQKGQDILLQAFARAVERIPRARLTLVGSGPEVEGGLRELSAALGIADRVTFAGYVAEPAPYLYASDCFVLASRWEGFGVALVEALQAGLPVVATDCDYGPADVVNDARIGVLVPPEDVAALAAALVTTAARIADTSGDRAARDRAYRRAHARPYLGGDAVDQHAQILRQISIAGSNGRRMVGLTSTRRVS